MKQNPKTFASWHEALRVAVKEPGWRKGLVAVEMSCPNPKTYIITRKEA